MLQLGYKQSSVDPCLYYRDGIMMVIYMDDCIIAGKDLSQIESAIEGISAKFEIAGEGEMDEYTLEGKWNK